MGKSILITVGTTGFDDLIEVISSKPFAEALSTLGYSRITVQYGSSIRKYSEEFLRDAEGSDFNASITVAGVALIK